MKDGTIRIESTDPAHVKVMADCKAGDKGACFKVKLHSVDAVRHETTHTPEDSKYPMSVMTAAMGAQPNGKRATLEGRVASIERMDHDDEAEEKPKPKPKRSAAIEAAMS